jgi:hypothetical protein
LNQLTRYLQGSLEDAQAFTLPGSIRPPYFSSPTRTNIHDANKIYQNHSRVHGTWSAKYTQRTLRSDSQRWRGGECQNVTRDIKGFSKYANTFSFTCSPNLLFEMLGDAVTIPTDAQLMAGLQASRGDDVYREDETTIALEQRIARLTGKRMPCL